MVSRNIKFFLFTLFFSFPFWWGMNIFQEKMEDVFYWAEISKNPQLLTAQISSDFEIKKLRSVRKKSITEPEIEAKSAISLLLKNDGKEVILFEKEKDKKLPIASLTKLMSADIVLSNYNLFDQVTITKKAIDAPENFGNFKEGEVFFVKDLLTSVLIESSNDAMTALAELTGEEVFVNLMNSKAKELNLENTYFYNSSGIDPDNDNNLTNYSTAYDLAKLAVYLLKENPEVFKISASAEADIYLVDGSFHHKAKNTNEFLTGKRDGVSKEEIIGSKTGWTPLAQGCLLLIIKAPENEGSVINVILGSDNNRFLEMEKLINWLKESYIW